MKLTLHIGTHKTGTTALQQFLHRNPESLAARGFHYVAPPSEYFGRLVSLLSPGGILRISAPHGVSEASRLAEETHVFGLIEQARAHFFRTQLTLRLLPGIYQSLIYLLRGRRAPRRLRCSARGALATL